MAKLSPIPAIGVLLGTMVGIYLVCYVIYVVKDLMFKLFRLNCLCELLGKKTDKVLPLNGFERD